MSAAGHRLSPKSVAWLERKTGLDIDLAFHPGSGAYEAVMRKSGQCVHVAIDPNTFGHTVILDACQYTSCPVVRDGE